MKFTNFFLFFFFSFRLVCFSLFFLIQNTHIFIIYRKCFYRRGILIHYHNSSLYYENRYSENHLKIYGLVTKIWGKTIFDQKCTLILVQFFFSMFYSLMCKNFFVLSVAQIEINLKFNLVHLFFSSLFFVSKKNKMCSFLSFNLLLTVFFFYKNERMELTWW